MTKLSPSPKVPKRISLSRQISVLPDRRLPRVILEAVAKEDVFPRPPRFALPRAGDDEVGNFP
jgi:hypothetical protein